MRHVKINENSLTHLEVGLSVAGIVVGVLGTLATLYVYRNRVTIVLSREQLLLLASESVSDEIAPPAASVASDRARAFDGRDFRARARKR